MMFIITIPPTSREITAISIKMAEKIFILACICCISSWADETLKSRLPALRLSTMASTCLRSSLTPSLSKVLISMELTVCVGSILLSMVESGTKARRFIYSRALPPKVSLP